MKINPKFNRGFSLIEMLAVVLIIATLASFGVQGVNKALKDADRVEATNNLKNLGLALFNFDNDYSSYPDSSTATTIQENNPNSGYSFGGSSSNDYFRQLIATKLVDDEKTFYSKTAYTVKPDEIKNSSQNALQKGEVGFGYIMNGNVAYGRSGGNSGRFIAVTPLKYPFATGKFDSKFYNNKVVALRSDSSVASLEMNGDNQALLGKRDIFTIGADSVWEDTTPTLVNPQPK